VEIVPLYEVCKNDGPTAAFFGDSNILRIFPFSFSKKKGFDLTKPYAVWQTVGGSPDNVLEGGACSDSVEVQIDVYAQSVDDCRQGANLIEAAIESECMITRYFTEEFEQDTKLFRATFGASWILKRG